MRKLSKKEQMAYTTIHNLETEVERKEAVIVRLHALLHRVWQADALSHNCPLWKAIDAELSPVGKI